MPATIRFDGLFELKEELTHATPELRAEAETIILAHADAAANALRAAYPRRTTGLRPGRFRTTPWFAPGQLKAKVFVSKRGGQFSIAATVKNTDPIAWLYDNGSAARTWANGKIVGAMPATHLFVRTVSDERRRMYENLKAMVARKGATVTGDA